MSAVALNAWWSRVRRVRGVDVDVDVHVTAIDGDGDLVGSVLNINVHFDLNQVLTPPVQET